MIPTKCERCGGPMSEGFLLDSTHNAVRVAQWAEGAPEYRFLRFLKMSGRAKLPIRSYRCARCGYLENYAVAERPGGVL